MAMPCDVLKPEPTTVLNQEMKQQLIWRRSNSDLFKPAVLNKAILRERTMDS
jgi:hypothetical protein